MLWLLLLPLLTALASARSVERNNDCGVLNSTYLEVSFGQSRSNINSYIHQSVQSLVLATNHSNGQFLDGITNLPGHLFYWQNLKTVGPGNDFLIDVVSAQNALARRPGDAFDTWGVPLVNIYNDDAGWAGLSNLQAYETYGRDIFLKRAVGVWEFLSTHGYIDQNVIDEGFLNGTKHPNITLMSECNGKSMIGGVYWVNGGTPQYDPSYFDAASSGDVNAVSTGNYALLSAELCRLTSDQKYCDRAYSCMDWMDKHMLAPNGLIYDHLNGTDCNLANYTFTYNAALYIATYAELCHLTNNSTAIDLSQRVAIAAMNTAQWNTKDGINKESEGNVAESTDGIGFKAILIRYLGKAYPWMTDGAVKAAVLRYINIQYYALTQLQSDSINQPIRYGRNWTGPAFNLSSEHAQLAALDVLNGIQLNPDSAFPDNSNKSVPVASASNSTC